MSKRFYIIHAWSEHPGSCWYPWLKKELETRGFEVQAPFMPSPDAPELNAWVEKLRELIPRPDEHTYFVGHSVGCQTILRYLARLAGDQKIGGAVFVAPWTHLVGLGEASQQIAKPWLETPIDWAAAKAHCPRFSAFFSDDDQYVPLREEQIFQAKLGAKTKLIRQAKHFDVIKEFPELLGQILGLAGES